MGALSSWVKRKRPPADHSTAFSAQLNKAWSWRLRLKCDGTRAETRFRLSVKRTSPFKTAGASVQSTTGSRGVRISGSNARYTMFRGSVKSTGYPLHSPVSPSLPLPGVTVCHHISTGLYLHAPICLHSAYRDNFALVYQ
jgi:hypothetical protein